ncbi:MAG: hypothetical protein K0R53_308, partial [Burkholderiales bacterium]|nr:hypothetical protein [Burkholderiales bacterium]
MALLTCHQRAEQEGDVYQDRVLPHGETQAEAHREGVLAGAAVRVDVPQIVEHQDRRGERAERRAGE